METEATTKYTKTHFTNGEHPPIQSKDELTRKLKNEFAMIPESFQIHGQPQETGLVIVSHDNLVATIKHPKVIAESFDHEMGKAEFFGKQTMEQIETSMAVPYGKEYSAMRASQVINNIKKNGLRDTTLQTGFATIGLEEESMHFDREGNPFRLPDDEQIETQNNTKEVALDPTGNLFELGIQVAESRIREANLRQENINPYFSFSILSKPHELQTNDGKHGPYVRAVTTRMYDKFFFPKPGSEVEKYWNNVAQEFGFKDFLHLRENSDIMAPWAVCASHINFGLRTEKINGSYEVGLEEGIAVADLMQSNFGTIMEWMTFSTPLAFGKKIGIEYNGSTKYPKDARAVARFITRSGYPGEFILSPDNYNKRAIRALHNGIADRIDRAGYTSYHADLDDEVASAHARTRLRTSGGSGKEKFDKPVGRVEFTGGGETPDLIALMSRNAMIVLSGIAAYEAVANGKHPAEYFANKFPSMSRDDELMELTHAYNFEGLDNPKSAALYEEGRAFLQYMKENYTHPEMQYIVSLAELGFNKLSEQTLARNYEEYLHNPRGSIADVMNHMFEDGYTPLEIAKLASEFERNQAEMLIKNGGDVLKMIGKN